MVYAYLRVSTGKQDAQNQRLGVERLASAKGLAIDEYIDDEGISGTKEPEKRQLGQLLGKLQKGDVLLAGEISRLGRSLFMVMRILEHCMNVGCKVYTAKDGYELGDNIQSKVLAFAFGLSAEIERDMISRRTKEALEKRALVGIKLGRPKGSVTNCVKLQGKENTIKSYLEKNMSYSQIGRMLNVDRMTVVAFCHRTGLDKYKAASVYNIKKYEDYLSYLNIDELKKYIAQNCTISDISQKTHAPQWAVTRFMLENNLQESVTKNRIDVNTKTRKENGIKEHVKW